jgi:hypothetical protein
MIFPKSKWGWIRAVALTGILAGVLVYFYLIPAVRLAGYAPQEGDIIFQSLPHVDLVNAIEGMTGSPYSHCGVVAKENGMWVVIESIFDVHETPLSSWARRGRWGRLAVYRLKPEYRSHIPKFVQELHEFLGRPYDYRYRMDDETIYCSELVWKAWKNATGEELGTPVRLGDMNWKPFEKTIRKYEAGPPPLDQGIISPRGLSEAKQLEKVYGAGF